MKTRTLKILAIETSCDETAAAVLEVRDGKDWPQIKTLSSIVKSQVKLHSKMGGVVPEAAARAHVKNILPVVKKALSDANIAVFDGRQKQQLSNCNSLNYIAVTQGPGLIPSLIVGVEFAKALSLASGKPLVPVNHMLGHLYSAFAGQTAVSKQQSALFPMISLIVSGGHTMIVLMKNIKDYKVLGQTVDDAAGEAFDKVAKLLKLPYPGGPEVSKLAEKAKSRTGASATGTGSKPDFEFPRPMIHNKNYDFSFSGLKTAVLYYIRDHVGKGLDPSLREKQNICKAFQDAAVDVLVSKTLRAAREFGAKSISLSGGVAANKSLRDELNVNCQRLNVKFMVPPINLCTDNAEMIGLAAAFMLHNGYRPKNYKQIRADSNLAL